MWVLLLKMTDDEKRLATDHEKRLAQHLGQVVRKHRTKHAWSQAHLAELADISADFLGLLERGQRLPAITTLVRLASVLGVSTDELTGGPQPEKFERPSLVEAKNILSRMPEELLSIVLALIRVVDSDNLRRPKARRRRIR